MATSVKTRKTDEKKRQIFLIGNVSHQIVGAKLPSNREVLQVFFYNMRFVNLTIKESAKLTIDAVMIFWRQARIPTRDDHKCADKIAKMYEEWREFTKSPVDRFVGTKKQKYDVFMDTLDDLFDIARANAIALMTIEEDKQFLMKQREKGRPGSMVGIDKKLADKEARSAARKKKEEERNEREKERQLSLSTSTLQQSGMFMNLKIFDNNCYLISLMKISKWTMNLNIQHTMLMMMICLNQLQKYVVQLRW